MAKKKQQVSELFKDLQAHVLSSAKSNNFIPDIITFVESPQWLALPMHPTNPINLFPMQKIILKAFYRGSIGNENVALSDYEIELCKKVGLTDEDRGDVISKYNNGRLFRELVLVWGRRSGKDFLVSIIALYEAMKLLECPGGDPYAMYEISSANSINILTIANSQEQAKIAFREIRDKLLYSPYFADKYMPEGVAMSGIFLLTPKDKKENAEFKAKGLQQKTKGSVAVLVGHSNSESLLGMGCIVLILDEVASYKNTGGASSADRIYTGLTPTVSTYVRKKYKKDENGDFVLDENGLKIITERIYDGKILSISTPRAKEGKFYELYSKAGEKEGDERLVCRLPTWEVNVQHTRESLRASQPTMSETEFNMEFGAEFSGIGAEHFFSEDQVTKCFKDHPFELREMGEPGHAYFCHLDPATSSHNYALIVLHRQFYLDPQTNKTDFFIVVDHVKYWQPSEGKPINEEEVNKYVLGLKRRFHLGMVTYDAWNSVNAISQLRKNSIPNKMTRFSRMYKNIIYKELENYINSDKLKIPFHSVLKSEMMELQRKFDSTGFKVFPKKDGDGVKTDDLCVLPSTVVFTQDGAEYIENIKIGDLILTHDGTYQDVSHYSRHAPNRNIVKIKPYYGLPLCATSNHPIEIMDQYGNRTWKPIDQVSLKDGVVRTFDTIEKPFKIDLRDFVTVDVKKHCGIKNYINQSKIRERNANAKWHNRKIISSKEFGYICGLYLSEGSISDHGVSFASHIKETDIHREFSQYCNDVFGFYPTLAIKQKDSLGCQSCINSQIVKKLFIHLFKHKSANDKVIPLLLMQSPLKFQKMLIRGLFDGDGCFSDNRIIFTTTSRLMANQIQQILLRLQIVSSISVSKRKGRPAYFKNRKISKHNADLYNIVITDAASFNKLAPILNLNRTKKSSIFHKPRYKLFNNYIVADIYKIEDTDIDSDVVNITVANNSSYVSESINSHNCDCLAGALYQAINHASNRLPYAKTVTMGITPSSNQINWRSMQGTSMGIGTGQQVSKNLENRSSWPNRRR